MTNKNSAIMMSCLAVTIVAAIFVVPGSFMVEAEVPHGVISITFDNNHHNQFDYAFPLMRDRGMVGTFYVVTDHISDFSGDASYMSIAELQTLQNSGNEIGSHGKSHVTFTSLSESKIRQECSVSKQVLENNGLTVANFAFPNGPTNTTVDSIVDDYYRSGRSWTDVGPYLTKIPTSQFSFAGFSAEGDSAALSALKQMVDQVYTTNSWAVIIFHNIIPGANSQPYITSSEDFASFLDYAISKSVQALTVNQVLAPLPTPTPTPSPTPAPTPTPTPSSTPSPTATPTPSPTPPPTPTSAPTPTASPKPTVTLTGFFPPEAFYATALIGVTALIATTIFVLKKQKKLQLIQTIPSSFHSA